MKHERKRGEIRKSKAGPRSWFFPALSLGGGVFNFFPSFPTLPPLLHAKALLKKKKKNMDRFQELWIHPVLQMQPVRGHRLEMRCSPGWQRARFWCTDDRSGLLAFQAFKAPLTSGPAAAVRERASAAAHPLTSVQYGVVRIVGPHTPPVPRAY